MSHGLRKILAHLVRYLLHTASRVTTIVIHLSRSLTPGPTPLLGSEAPPYRDWRTQCSWENPFYFVLRFGKGLSHTMPFPPLEAKTSLFPRGWQYLALTLRLADVACASFLRTSLRTQPLPTVAISALGHSAPAAFCKLRAQPLLWAQKGTRAEHAEDWQHSGRSGQGRQQQAPMQLQQPHLLHFLGEHSHCNALRTSWYTTEPLVQCRGTCMGSVRVGEQQEHWSCTSLMSMEYMALLAHLPCKKAEEDGSFTMVESPGPGRALGQPAFSLTPPSEADLISPRSTQDS